MSEHTPGPWEASRWRVCHDITGRAGVICDTATNTTTRTPENEANARLIAAAPDLLRELTRLVDVLAPFETDGMRLESARAVIAKARRRVYQDGGSDMKTEAGKFRKVAVIDGIGESAEIHLRLEDEDGECVSEISWPDDWPEKVNGIRDRRGCGTAGQMPVRDFLVANGYKVVIA